MSIQILFTASLLVVAAAYGWLGWKMRGDYEEWKAEEMRAIRDSMRREKLP